jgi:hypothetical protein
MNAFAWQWPWENLHAFGIAPRPASFARGLKWIEHRSAFHRDTIGETALLSVPETQESRKTRAQRSWDSGES